MTGLLHLCITASAGAWEREKAGDRQADHRNDAYRIWRTQPERGQFQWRGSVLHDPVECRADARFRVDRVSDGNLPGDWNASRETRR